MRPTAHNTVKITFTWTWCCCTENNSGAFLLADPISEHASHPLLFFLGYLHGNKSWVFQLLTSSCCLSFPNRRQTLQRACFHANSPDWWLQKNRAHEHLPEPVCQLPCQGYSHVHRNHLTILPTKAAVYMASVHCETFRPSSMEGKSLTLRPCWEGPTVGCNINHQSGKALLACDIPKCSMNMWHWGQGTINMRLRLLQKQHNGYKRFKFCSCPEFPCNFYSFISMLLLFQWAGYVESPSKGGKLTVTCSMYLSQECAPDSAVKGQRIHSGNKTSLFSNFVPVKSVQLFPITSRKHSAFPKVF